MTTTHMPPAPIPDSELEPWDPQHPTTAAASDLDGWSAPVEKAASEQSQPASSCTPTSSKPGTTPRCRPRPHLLLQLTAAAPPSCFFSSLLLPPHLLLIAACRFSTSFTDRKAEAYHKCTKFGQVAALSQHHPSEIHCFSYAAARRCHPTARPLREAYPGQASRSSGQRSNPGPVPVSELGGQAGSQVAWCRQVPNQTVSASCLALLTLTAGPRSEVMPASHSVRKRTFSARYRETCGTMVGQPAALEKSGGTKLHDFSISPGPGTYIYYLYILYRETTPSASGALAADASTLIVLLPVGPAAVAAELHLMIPDVCSQLQRAANGDRNSSVE